jgi:hemin uptake protein HemP
MNPNQLVPDAAQQHATNPGLSAIETGTRNPPQGIVPASMLFNGNQEILINHNGEHYRLRITKNDKLILTK